MRKDRTHIRVASNKKAYCGFVLMEKINSSKELGKWVTTWKRSDCPQCLYEFILKKQFELEEIKDYFNEFEPNSEVFSISKTKEGHIKLLRKISELRTTLYSIEESTARNIKNNKLIEKQLIEIGKQL